MKIVNPLYDNAFKYLMQNDRIAKLMLSIILDADVEELQLSQQETVVPDTKRHLTLFRLDFKALIKHADGTKQKVLIELQKSKYETDIQRFRTYLGMNYMKPELEKDQFGKDQKKSYPIITIYILGYKIAEIPYLAVTVNRTVINSVSKQPVEINSDFVNQLTHLSHILQIRRLPDKRQSKLEKFLVFFNQTWITEHKYILDLHDVPAEFEDIAQYLQAPVMDEEFRRQLEAEEEIDTIFDNQEAKYLQQIAQAQSEAEEERRQKEEERRQKEEALAKEKEERRQKEEALAKEKEERRQKEEALATEKEALAKEKEALEKEKEKSIKWALKMLKYNEPIEEIMRETGLSLEESERLDPK